LIGNPTNIIGTVFSLLSLFLLVGEANNMTFADYSMWMVAVALSATATAFFMIYYLFRNELNRTFVPPELDPQAALKDKKASIVHSIVLILTLFSLSIAPWLGAPLWALCAGAALVVFIYNSCNWPWSYNIPLPASEQLQDSPVKPNDSCAVGINSSENSRLLESGTSESIGGSFGIAQKKNPFGEGTPMPTLKASLAMLPWRIVPFVFGMFTLVEGMRKSGWIDLCAESLVSLIPNATNNMAAAIFTSCFLMTSVTILLSNLINNQPATILLTRVIISPGFLNLPEAVRSVGMFGVILGSNLGANFTLIGALAGIMFAKILSEKGIKLSYLDFAKTGFKIMPIVTVISCGILAAEHLAIA